MDILTFLLMALMFFSSFMVLTIVLTIVSAILISLLEYLGIVKDINKVRLLKYAEKCMKIGGVGLFIVIFSAIILLVIDKLLGLIS